MAEKSSKIEKINFQLGPRQARFETPDGSVKLNRLEGVLNGSVSSDNRNAFIMVATALHLGTLIRTDKEIKNKIEDAEELIDVTNFAENGAKTKADAIQLLRKLKVEELLPRIANIKDHKLIATMIEQESFGRNISRRRREDIVDALKKRLETIQKTLKTSMVEYTENPSDTELKEVAFAPST